LVVSTTPKSAALYILTKEFWLAAKLVPLISIANSVQPVVVISNKLVNKIFFIFYFSFGITHPTLLGFGYTFAVGDINMSVSVAVITNRFIHDYTTSVDRLFFP
jgi:hypothetical protein